MKFTSALKIIAGTLTVIGVIIIFLVDIKGWGVIYGGVVFDSQISYEWWATSLAKWLLVSISPVIYILVDIVRWFRKP